MYKILFYLALSLFVFSCGSEDPPEEQEQEIDDPYIGEYTRLTGTCDPIGIVIFSGSIEIIAQENPDDGYLLQGFFSTDLQLDTDGIFAASPHDNYSFVEVSIDGNNLSLETQEVGINSFQKCNYVFKKSF